MAHGQLGEMKLGSTYSTSFNYIVTITYSITRPSAINVIHLHLQLFSVDTVSLFMSLCFFCDCYIVMIGRVLLFSNGYIYPGDMPIPENYRHYQRRKYFGDSRLLSIVHVINNTPALIIDKIQSHSL